MYKVNKKDIKKSGIVYADAFEKDPVWKRVFSDIEYNLRTIFFQGPARYCLKYGEVYSPSDKLEGIMSFVPGKYADMTFWRALHTGSFLNLLKGGNKLLNLMFKMQPIFSPLEEARREVVKDREYIYLIAIGVSPEHQGKGFGKTLLTFLHNKADKLKLPIYLETATDKNIRMYEKLGYKVTGKVNHPIINVPQWGMLREPCEK